MGSIFDSVASLYDDGGVVLLVIVVISIVAWSLLFVKWIAVRARTAELNEASQIDVRINRSTLAMWIDGERGSIFEGFGPIHVSAALLPLLGLLGTVMGMLETFEVIKIEGTGDPRLMADGIRKALLTTQAGIFTALTVLVGARVLNSRAARLERSVELALQRAGSKANHRSAPL